MAKTNMNVSWSRLKEWMTCHWRYWLKYEEYIRTKKLAEPLYFGRGFHELLEYIYSEQKGNPTYKRRNRKAVRAKLKRLGYEDEDLETMVKYTTRYLAHIQRHKSQEPSKVLATEFRFSVPLDMGYLNGMLRSGARVPYATVNFIGVMDIIVIRQNRVEIWDHKLQSNHPRTGELDHPSISYPQMGIYPYASKLLGHFIRRGVLNVYGKRRKEHNVQRYPLIITQIEARMWGRWLYKKTAEMLTSSDRSKSLGSFYCGNCDYRFACVKHQSQGPPGLKMALKQGFEKKPFDPRLKNVVWETEFPPAMLKQMKEP